jgi:hypothetical protein
MIKKNNIKQFKFPKEGDNSIGTPMSLEEFTATSKYVDLNPIHGDHDKIVGALAQKIDAAKRNQRLREVGTLQKEKQNAGIKTRRVPYKRKSDIRKELKHLRDLIREHTERAQQDDISGGEGDSLLDSRIESTVCSFGAEVLSAEVGDQGDNGQGDGTREDNI